MNQNEASLQREVTVQHPYVDKTITFRGAEVYSVNEKGIVIASRTARTFYPWSRVNVFLYNHADEAARKVIQGW